jgi:hypothetical protein
LIKEGDNLVKYLIEIKPFKQTKEPKNTGKRKKAHLLYEQIQYVNNQEKWAAAKKWAAGKGFIFKIITEKDLNN